MTFRAALRQVVLVDDDEGFRSALAERLALAGLDVSAHASAASVLKTMKPGFEGVVVTDLRMPGIDGRQLIGRLRDIDPDLPVVMMTGHGDVEEAVEAMKAGAYDFITKPFHPERMIETLRRALEKRALVLDNRRLVILAGDDDWSLPLSGESPAIERLRGAIRQLAEAPLDVLIEGETGAGKEAVARAIHRGGARQGGPFVAVACGALSDADAALQLMGQEAGAAPGALKRRIGQIEQSAGGALFLDEIDLAPRSVQLLLLRVLEEREILAIGAAEPRALDLRIMAATKADPLEAVSRGDLREDLYYRLSVSRLRVPPVRERREDVPVLFARFLSRAAARLGRDLPDIDDGVRRRLLEYEWPGNLRELSNYASQLAAGLSDPGQTSLSSGSLSEKIQAYEAQLITEALAAHAGDIRKVMDALQLPRKTLYDKMARLGLRPAAHRQTNY